METRSVKLGSSVSARDLSRETAEGCVSMCGMCPSCVFAPRPPGCSRCLWKVSDEFKRRFVVELLLRCRDVQVLEGVQSVLGVTSWTLFAYARSRGPTTTTTTPPQDQPRRGTRRAPGGKPLGIDVNGIWDWFGRSPDWIKSRYLCGVFSLCDAELLRMVSNLTSVLLVRQKRGFLQFNSSSRNTHQHDPDADEDPEDPALMVVPGSSKSVSGVSRYRDFIGCLPVGLSKRILGLLDEHTLRRCQRVCQYWQRLAKETIEEIKFSRNFQDQIKAMMKRCKGVNTVCPTYSNIAEVLVPATDDERAHVHSSGQKVRPFEAAYAKIQTRTVLMEERNVYCGAYFTKVLLNKEDPHRVVDYRGGSFMAMGSKDRVVNLFHVASEAKAVSVLRGHVGSVRAVLLCEDRGLLITASCDASIRCWSLKTDRCEVVLYGHTGTVNCLDVHADRLVSGAKDCSVKVWNLRTGKHVEDLNFKHPGSVQCVKTDSAKVYSGCDRGLVKIWDVEEASLLRVIDAHRSSLKCLFCDEWHLLSGDFSGQVMAWSTSCHARERLTTFSHPKEVKSLTLVYLRVVTGCVDGKIRVFDFLTGDCLREISTEAEAGRILSLHFHDNSILVNLTSGVRLYQFAKMFWDHAASEEGARGDAQARGGPVSEKSAASLRSLPRAPLSRKTLPRTRFLSPPAKSQAAGAAGPSASERAACERVRRRGPHHPPTRDCILLRVGAIQRAWRPDQLTANMERNAGLRDCWGPGSARAPRGPRAHDSLPRRAQTCVPILKRAAGGDVTRPPDPDAAGRDHVRLLAKKSPPRSADSHRAITRATSAKEGPQAPEGTKTSTSFPRIKTFGAAQASGLSQSDLTGRGSSGKGHMCFSR